MSLQLHASRNSRAQLAHDKRAIMRSDRIYKALVNIQNRFMLCRLVSVATRKFHDPDMRVQDIISDVIERFADTGFATQQLKILADLETKLPAA